MEGERYMDRIKRILRDNYSSIENSPNPSASKKVKRRKKKQKNKQNDSTELGNSTDKIFNFNKFFKKQSTSLNSSFNESLEQTPKSICSELLGNSSLELLNCTFTSTDTLEVGKQNCKKRKSETTHYKNMNIEVFNNVSHEDIEPHETEKSNNTTLNESPGDIDSSFDDFLTDEESAIINFHKYSQADYYNLPTGKLIVLNPTSSICFHGLTTFKVLRGILEINGFELTESSKEVNVYSPRGTALLYLQNHQPNNNKTDLLTNVLVELKQYNFLENIVINLNSVVFLCKKLVDIKIAFMDKFISQQIFPKIDDKDVPQVIFEPRGNWNIIKTHPEWDSVIAFSDHGKLMLTGGKGVGKSTFLRYAINRLLLKHDEIRVIDLDPGQSEFTIPGCISIVHVTEPLLGPSYTHMKTPVRSILSDINIGNDPKRYLDIIQELMNFNNTLPVMPTVINYMGFSGGIGLPLVSSAISYIQPNVVLQIISDKSRKNYTTLLTPEVVLKNVGLFKTDPFTNYELLQLPSMSDQNNNSWNLEPRQMREMAILTYFGRMMHDNALSLTSDLIEIRCVSLDAIQLTNVQGEVISEAAVNANLVALCSSNSLSNTFTVHGWGVVRAIDLTSRKLYLLTPEAVPDLEDVTHLILGSASLPPSVYMTTDDVVGHVPYVMNGELCGLAQLTKRSYIPPNKK